MGLFKDNEDKLMNYSDFVFLICPHYTLGVNVMASYVKSVAEDACKGALYLSKPIALYSWCGCHAADEKSMAADACESQACKFA